MDGLMTAATLPKVDCVQCQDQPNERRRLCTPVKWRMLVSRLLPVSANMCSAGMPLRSSVMCASQTVRVAGISDPDAAAATRDAVANARAARVESDRCATAHRPPRSIECIAGTARTESEPPEPIACGLHRTDCEGGCRSSRVDNCRHDHSRRLFRHDTGFFAICTQLHERRRH